MSKFTTANQVLVAFQKEYLTGLQAGQIVNAHVVANSVKSARVTARDLRENKVQEGELSGDLFRVRNVKVVRFTKGLVL